MGKYTHLKGQLPILEESEYPDRVAAYKEMHCEKTTAVLAEAFHQVKVRKELVEKQLKELNAEQMALSSLLVSRFEDENVTSIKFGFGTLYINDDVRTKVHDKDALYAALRGEGLGELIQETVPWQTLNSLTKERLLQGQELFTGTDAALITTIRERKNA